MLDFQISLLLLYEPMDKKLRRRFKANVIIFIFLIVSCPSFFSFANNNGESNQSTNINPFLEEFISRHAAQIGESEQLIFVSNMDSPSFHVMIHTLGKKSGGWHTAFPGFDGLIGEKGFAPIGEKREGDGKTPSGIFPLGTAFGYDASVATKMPYRQAADDDFWVDDVNSEDYNKWVQGEPNATSWEKMKREDDQYKYGVVIEYNTHPIVKGNGSAIFLHVWKSKEPTSGCVSTSEEMVLKILGWLDPTKKPLVIMGTESELAAMGRASRARVEGKAEAAAHLEKVCDIVDIKQVSPHIIVDMKYATENNFMKKRLYDSNTCFLRESTAVKLDSVQKELDGMNLGLKVWDCYRPLSVQRTLWMILSDERYVANPKTGSRHNRASSVDVTLVDSEGKELQMPTGFDDFSPKASHHYQDLPDQEIRNRELLNGLMEKAGFIPLPEEWWHYDDEKWVQYDIMDVSFEDLLKHRN
jgi:D-alanyl-D-alanine dipeptidase/L,D-peptidoglycan transpeptidase YkuD (ErfK/YbiS/YcfS/YnhG family)